MPAKNSHTTPYWSTSATFPQFAKLAEDVVDRRRGRGRRGDRPQRGISAGEGGQTGRRARARSLRRRPTPDIPARI